MCVGCSSVFALAAVVVLMRVVGGIGCLSLLFTKSLAMESHFEPSCAVVSQVVSFVCAKFASFYVAHRDNFECQVNSLHARDLVREHLLSSAFATTKITRPNVPVPCRFANVFSHFACHACGSKEKHVHAPRHVGTVPLSAHTSDAFRPTLTTLLSAVFKHSRRLNQILCPINEKSSQIDRLPSR